ncbi:Flagellin protein FlaA [hydrothermal vent metagenome]|uniref:Flagellin protein FlaA n=2 Tax=hydrothermal vent metagenome TaxID=652676 RepID=A0A3B0S6W7_9ZZZZ
MSSLLTNESSLIALTTLRSINKNLNMVQQQISTGKSVSNARDNASIWAVATVMQSDVDSFSAISDSLNLGASTVAVARGASEQVTSLLQEMKNLVVAAQEDNVDRAKIQTDVDQLTEQIDSIVGAAQFNGLNLLSGTGSVSILASLDRAADGTVTASEISIARDDISVTGGTAVTATGTITDPASMADGSSTPTTATAVIAGTVVEGETYNITNGADTYYYVARAGDGVNEVAAGLAGVVGTNITDVAAAAAGDTITFTNSGSAAVDLGSSVTDSNTSGLAAVANIDVTSSAGATSALSAIEGFIQVGIDAAAAFGSAQKRIDIQNEFITTLSDSMKLGIGALTDTNMEEASARLQSLQVQQQLGIQTLAIANQRPQVLLGLFQ